jgi:hypothetical protein
MHACALLASPAESGMTIILGNDHHLREIMHQPNWSHTPGKWTIYATTVEILIAREAWFYLREPQGHIYIWYEHVRTDLNVETAELRQPVSDPSPSARIRASSVSPYESLPRQPVWEPAQSARMRAIYATLPLLATLCGARNKQTNMMRNLWFS